MLFSHLIHDLPFAYTLSGANRGDDQIAHISNDSRQVRQGSIFVCVKGVLADGHAYAKMAYDDGCRIFVAERLLPLPEDAAVMLTVDTRTALACLSVKLYGSPSEELRVVGITGTKGKTTSALMVAHVLNQCGIPTGYIGSNGVDYGKYHFATVNTTPESCDIQRYLRDMVTAGMQVCVMEVSSQALKLARVHGLKFDTCVFTNLSPDHISEHEHPDFEDYKACKASLFTDYPCRYVIYNADDPQSEDVIGSSRAPYRIRIALHHYAEFLADELTLLRNEQRLGLRFLMKTTRGTHKVELPFPGAFSAYNALIAAAVCHRFGLSDHRIAKALEDVSISGRFETIMLPNGATVVIDYAHNGVSLRSALETLRQYEPNRLICLFGSVGGRTQMRRAELGRVAAELADLCILTADNPDNEPARDVINDIAKSFKGSSCPYRKIPDREEAILYAMSISQPNDIILLAGKGHERYQLIAGHHFPFCERDIVTREALKMALSNI